MTKENVGLGWVRTQFTEIFEQHNEEQSMTQAEKTARIERIREMIKLLRQHATEGHMPYVVDTLELMADLLERS